MTAKEIIEHLKKYPEDMEVYVPSNHCDYEFGKTYSVYKDRLCLEDEEDETYIECIIIDEI